MTDKKDAHIATKRPVRKPLHKRKALQSQGRPGFYQRWVNEVPGAVDAYLEAGYTLVVDPKANISDKTAQTSSHSGSAVRATVNTNPLAKSHTAVLMEIPLEFYKEDQAEKQRILDEEEKSWDPNNQKNPGFYGNLSTTKTAVMNRGEDK